ncbi:MAG: vitamin B12-dependent ribonucleotide reductase [Thermosulfidibacteraceae bacterium]|jgi:ribonucleoside-diphosphate reductase alpha chain
MKLNKIALKILEARYLKRDEKGQITESPEELFKRVAYSVGIKENQAIKERFKSIMEDLKFLPNSPCLMNAGTPMGQLAACFVLPIEDSMESIFETLKNAALIHKSGGGTGFSFSRLRPKGDIVKSTKGISSGPVSFLIVYDAATEAIKQGGKRRGANMGVLNCNHPDIVEFVNLKSKPGVLKNFNISVAATDEFMEAIESKGEIALINPRTGEREKSIKAYELFRMIVETAWKTGDPGMIFIDRINFYNPTPQLGKIESTNPCGEQPLLPYESCVLGSINLVEFIKDGGIDWESLKETIYLAVRFLDDVIDVNVYPIRKIEMMTKKTRKIGLGIMGLADLFLKLGIPYGSEESYKIASNLMEFIQFHSKMASIDLAIERGSFPEFEGSIYKDKEAIYRFLNIDDTSVSSLPWDELVERIHKYGIRNATTTTVAPTGTISLIAGVSSGIEPIFAFAVRRVMLDEETDIIHPLVSEIMEKYDLSEKDRERIIKTGKISDIERLPRKVREVFLTTYEIPLEAHIRMQAVIQKFVDNAVSKTINLPYEATVEDVERAYLLSYSYNCKGITVFRDRCYQDQVIKAGMDSEKITVPITPKERSRILKGKTIKLRTGCGNMYVTVNENVFGPFEVFSQLGKAGGCAASQLEAISRLISLSLRSGVNVNSVIKQLAGIRCPNPSWDEGIQLLSCADAIAKAIKMALNIDLYSESEEGVAGICPDCGNILRAIEGCLTCEVCGYSKC